MHDPASGMRSTDAAPGQRRRVLPPDVLRLASDERLVAAVRAGSEEAFEALYRRHYGAIFAYCRQMLGSPHEAEDAVQHAFIAAYVDLMSSAKLIVLRPWLYTIARHRCVTVLRARRHRPVGFVNEPAAEQLATEVDVREELRAMMNDIAQLPEDQRVALVLTELGGAPHGEIAQILGCSGSRVRALVFQARSSLAANREAREIPCAVIRHRLATSRGGALRRGELRRHLRQCEGCRAFSEELRLRRRGFMVLVPIAPAVGLKRAVLGALFGSSSGGAGGGAAIASLLGSGVAARALVTLVIAGGGTAVSVTASGGRGEAAGARRPAITAANPATDVPRAHVGFAVDRVTRDRPGDRATARAGEPNPESPAGTGPQRTNPAPAPGEQAETPDPSERPSPSPEQGPLQPASTDNAGEASQGPADGEPAEPAEDVGPAKPTKPPQSHSQSKPPWPPPHPQGPGQSPGPVAAQSHGHGAAQTPALSAQPTPPRPGGNGPAGSGEAWVALREPGGAG